VSPPRWRRFPAEHGGDYPTAKKKPPPADGIKMTKVGETWWAKRWIAALEEVLGGQAGRLARGRSYARAGRVHDLVVEKGKVTARVTGTAPTPYRVSLALEPLADDVWTAAVAGMAEKAQFLAALLGGEMPEDIDEVFRAAERSLFPRKRGARAELSTRCSCPDAVDPCKHVAATHYVLGEALDRDPLLLFEMRGRTRDEVLAALREARGSEVSAAPEAKSALAAQTVALATSADFADPADYDRAPEPLPTMHFSFDAEETGTSSGNVLRQLGAPPGWDEASSPADTFSPLIRRAAEAARQAALAEPAGRALTPKRRRKPAS
jgi:uncharacterized Zn finger protein